MICILPDALSRKLFLLHEGLTQKYRILGKACELVIFPHLQPALSRQ